MRWVIPATPPVGKAEDGKLCTSFYFIKGLNLPTFEVFPNLQRHHQIVRLIRNRPRDDRCIMKKCWFEASLVIERVASEEKWQGSAANFKRPCRRNTFGECDRLAIIWPTPFQIWLTFERFKKIAARNCSDLPICNFNP